MKKIILLLSLNILLFATDISDFINKHQCDQIIDKQIYTICYSYKYKGALGGWTVLDGDKVNAVNIKKRPRFYEDKTIPKNIELSIVTTQEWVELGIVGILL